MPAIKYLSGEFNIISEFIKVWIGGLFWWNKSLKEPSWLYITDRLVAEAQFEARVGKANKGLFIVSDKVFEVSIDFPPPTANIISASLTSFLFFKISTFS